MSLRTLADVVGGALDDDSAAGVVVDSPPVVDSREAGPGALFVAIAGERTDGHLHGADAARRGARAALGTRPVDGLPTVVVDDAVDALGRLAGRSLAELRSTTPLRVVGITGSSGKTSTKDLLAQVLATAGDTVAPVGSFNNEIGLPLTVLRADRTTRFLVLEMSARGVGHIAALCAIAPVDVAAVLNVGSAHVGEFGSREAIATAKAELLAGVVDGGVTVLNVDDPLVAAMRSAARGGVVGVGRSADAEIRATDVVLDSGGCPGFTVIAGPRAAHVQLRLVGEHHVGNALAVTAVALELGLDLDEVATALSAATPRSRWRMEMRQTADGVRIVNDAYNANPESMRAAIAALVHLGAGGRTWAVLGPMAELGESTADEHSALGRHCAEAGVSRVVAVGEVAADIAHAARAAGADATVAADVEEVVALLRAELARGDTVLVKASRSAGLERVVDALAVESTGDAA